MLPYRTTTNLFISRSVRPVTTHSASHCATYSPTIFPEPLTIFNYKTTPLCLLPRCAGAIRALLKCDVSFDLHRHTPYNSNAEHRICRLGRAQGQGRICYNRSSRLDASGKPRVKDLALGSRERTKQGKPTQSPHPFSRTRGTRTIKTNRATRTTRTIETTRT